MICMQEDSAPLSDVSSSPSANGNGALSNADSSDERDELKGPDEGADQEADQEACLKGADQDADQESCQTSEDEESPPLESTEDSQVIITSIRH